MSPSIKFECTFLFELKSMFVISVSEQQFMNDNYVIHGKIQFECVSSLTLKQKEIRKSTLEMKTRS